MAQHALIIGIDTFGLDRNVQPLQFARADARATHEVFKDTLGYGDNAHLLLQPTLSQARRALHSVGEQVHAGDTFVFYFAGHGAQHQNEQYLLLHEVNLAALERGDVVSNDLLSLSALTRTVADWPEVHSAYILDACRTPLRKGARTASYSAEVQEPLSGVFPRDVLLARSAGGNLVLNACADGQQAFEVEALGRGLFSHSFCRWLKEGARQAQARVLSAAVLDELAQLIESDAQAHQAHRGQRPWVNPQAIPVVLWRPAVGGLVDEPTPPRALNASEVDERLWLLTRSKVRALGVKAYEDYVEKAPPGAVHLEEAVALIEAWHEEQAKAKARTEAAEQEAMRLQREVAERERQEQQRQEEQLQALRQAEARAGREAEEAAEAKSRADRERAEYLRPGRRFKEAAWAPEMVVIPAGRFVMGSPESEPERISREGPQHEVSIAQSFALGRCVVTFDEYDRFAKAVGRELPSEGRWGRGGMPAINVSWEDAQAYTEWLNGELGLKAMGPKYRLPTEAEWEYAARAGTETAFWWGDTIDPSNANYNGDSAYAGGAKGMSRLRTVKADAFDPNPWGLHQVHGNVCQWVQDGWHEDYKGAPGDGGEWKAGADEARRVLRGGSWNNGPRYLRAAYRFGGSPGNRDYIIGFRIARTL